MAKGTPRTATAAVEIIRQHEQTEPQRLVVETHSEPAETRRVELAATEGGSPFPRKALNDGTPVAYRPAKRGVNAGLRQGETRITCIYRQDQSQVLHDWAKTTGRTFRQVCLAMADRYIEEVIRPATSGDHKLINTGDVPEAYADMYDAETPDEWAQFFK